jgi:hypothetical protein
MSRPVVSVAWPDGTEIWSDGRTVWVNGTDGCCLGRFSKNGIDIHKDAAGQMASGDQCLDCKIGPTTNDDWLSFQAGMKRHYGISVDDKHMPKFLVAA